MKTVQLILPPTADGEAWRRLDVSVASTRGPSRILLVPGALVLAREVDVMGRTEAQARAATLAALSGELAMPADACVCVLGEPDGGKRMAFVIERSTLEARVSAARLRGYAVDAVAPDFAVLPPQPENTTVIARHGDCLVRTDSTAFACQPELLTTILGDRPIQEVDFTSAARQWIAAGQHVTAPNLLVSRSVAPERHPGQRPLLAGVAAAVALAIFAALPWIEANQLDAATNRLRAQTEQVARAALPGAQRIVNPVAQLREASLPRQEAATGLQNAVTVMEGLTRSPGVAIARLSYDSEAVRAHVGVPSTALLQPLRDHIAANGLNLVEVPGLSEPNSIPVELTVTAAP